jgi:hypothetical protein
MKYLLLICGNIIDLDEELEIYRFDEKFVNSKCLNARNDRIISVKWISIGKNTSKLTGKVDLLIQYIDHIIMLP